MSVPPLPRDSKAIAITEGHKEPRTLAVCIRELLGDSNLDPVRACFCRPICRRALSLLCTQNELQRMKYWEYDCNKTLLASQALTTTSEITM